VSEKDIDEAMRQVRQNASLVFAPFVVLKTIILPRQARDKHGKVVTKRGMFFFRADGRGWVGRGGL
jgi:hypothetical protein